MGGPSGGVAGGTAELGLSLTQEEVASALLVCLRLLDHPRTADAIVNRSSSTAAVCQLVRSILHNCREQGHALAPVLHEMAPSVLAIPPCWLDSLLRAASFALEQAADGEEGRHVDGAVFASGESCRFVHVAHINCRPTRWA